MKSRTLVSIILSTAALVAPSLAHADNSDPTNYTPPPAPAEAPAKPGDVPAQRLALHVAPAFFAPIGNLSDATQALGGGLAGIDYRLSSHATLTIRGGYLAALASQDQTIAGMRVQSSLDIAPVLGGVKWYILQPNEGFFFATEGGAIVAIGSTRVAGQAGNVPVTVNSSGSDTHFGAGAYLGIETGRWDFRAGMLTLDVGHVGNSTGVMASASLAFAQF
jgi:hypothetical protein